MSSPLSPETSLPSDDSIDAEVYANELARIMEDPLSLAQIVNAFDNDPTGTAILRLFHFISDTMNRTRQEMTRLRNEREEVYEYAITSAHFRQMIRTIVRDHRERQTIVLHLPLPSSLSLTNTHLSQCISPLLVYPILTTHHERSQFCLRNRLTLTLPTPKVHQWHSSPRPRTHQELDKIPST